MNYIEVLMKWQKKMSIATSIVLCLFGFLGNALIVYADSGVAPRVALYEQTFYHDEVVQLTESISVTPYGISASKNIGTVTIYGVLECEEAWLVDQFGNLRSCLDTTNYKFSDIDSPNTRYSLKIGATATNESVRLSSDKRTISVDGWAVYTQF